MKSKKHSNKYELYEAMKKLLFKYIPVDPDKYEQAVKELAEILEI